MPPVHPAPTITTSTALLATTYPSLHWDWLEHLIGKTLGRHVVGIGELVDVVAVRIAIGHGVPRVAHPLPSDKVVVPTVHWIREQSFLHILKEHAEELIGWDRHRNLAVL